ncbi:hypothetical protein BDW71DRAFT_31966 [Aspergillus fruticulosus]
MICSLFPDCVFESALELQPPKAKTISSRLSPFLHSEVLANNLGISSGEGETLAFRIQPLRYSAKRLSLTWPVIISPGLSPCASLFSPLPSLHALNGPCNQSRPCLGFRSQDGESSRSRPRWIVHVDPYKSPRSNYESQESDPSPVTVDHFGTLT